jgi:molybdenum cofactor synthesis domain-containing protein
MAELRVGVITCSDRCHAGEAEDLSGREIVDTCEKRGWDVVGYDVVPDEQEAITLSIIELADVDNADVVFTTGGTGLSPRDVTPEATLAACPRLVPGVAEAVRAESFKVTRRAMLSRAIAAQRGTTLVINLPGSVKAVRETLAVVLDQLEHARDMAAGCGH